MFVCIMWIKRAPLYIQNGYLSLYLVDYPTLLTTPWKFVIIDLKEEYKTIYLVH